MLPVTFGTRKNYRTESVTFDVSDMPLPYNGILGRPALAKFMAVAHYAYNTPKIPAKWGVLTVKADTRDTVFCVEQIYEAVAASEPAAEPGSSQEDEPESSTQGGPYCSTCMPLGPKGAGATLPHAMQGRKRPRESPEAAPGRAPAVDAEAGPGPDPGKVTSVGPAPCQQKLKGEQQLTKKVSLHGDAAHCVIIGAMLSHK